MGALNTRRPNCICPSSRTESTWIFIPAGGMHATMLDQGDWELRCAWCGHPLAIHQPVIVCTSAADGRPFFDFPDDDARNHGILAALSSCKDGNWVRTGRRSARCDDSVAEVAWVEAMAIRRSASLAELAHHLVHDLASATVVDGFGESSFYRRLMELSGCQAASGHWGTVGDEETVTTLAAGCGDCSSPVVVKLFAINCTLSAAGSGAIDANNLQDVLTSMCRKLAPSGFYAIATIATETKDSAGVELKRDRSYELELEIGQPWPLITHRESGLETAARPFRVVVFAQGMDVSPSRVMTTSLQPSEPYCRMKFMFSPKSAGLQHIRLNVSDGRASMRIIPLDVAVHS